MRQTSPSTVEDALECLPGAQGDIARAALKATFGAEPVESIDSVLGGTTTALAWRVQVGGRGYLLRVEGEPSPLRNPYQYESMRIAADAGITPRIRHMDEDARVVVTDFIEQRPLRDYPGGLPGLAKALGELLQRLRATPVFPYYVDYPDVVRRMLADVRQTDLFADGLLDRHTERLDDVCQSYNAGLAGLFSSHNDAHPGNLIFDGQRIWLIDWEAACRNDPMVDLATSIDSFGFSPELEALLARTWLGRAPDEAFYDRLATVRALTRLYYAAVFLSIAASQHTRTAPDTDLSIPSLDTFNQSVHDGVLKASPGETMLTRGKMYLASFLSGDPVPGFGPAPKT